MKEEIICMYEGRAAGELVGPVRSIGRHQYGFMPYSSRAHVLLVDKLQEEGRVTIDVVNGEEQIKMVVYELQGETILGEVISRASIDSW